VVQQQGRDAQRTTFDHLQRLSQCDFDSRHSAEDPTEGHSREGAERSDSLTCGSLTWNRTRRIRWQSPAGVGHPRFRADLPGILVAFGRGDTDHRVSMSTHERLRQTKQQLRLTSAALFLLASGAMAIAAMAGEDLSFAAMANAVLSAFLGLWMLGSWRNDQKRLHGGSGGTP
jgi:hypothetical protein